MKTTLLSLVFALIGIVVYAQPGLTETNRKALIKMEDSLKITADSMINGQTAAKRFRSDSTFIRNFVKALQVPYSFDFAFDSIQSISRLYAPDSSFRIFTWQLKKDE